MLKPAQFGFEKQLKGSAGVDKRERRAVKSCLRSVYKHYTVLQNTKGALDQFQ